MWFRGDESWATSRRVFLAGLGLVYFFAFASLWIQVDGLYGKDGIAPVASLIADLSTQLVGAERLRVPTLFWFGASDLALNFGCGIGVVFAVVLMCGTAPRFVCAALWLVYLSFVAIGRPFLPFQWDTLLLETGLLACLYAPGGLLPFQKALPAPSRAVRLLLLWLLFRLVFNSALRKIGSGDEVWRDLSALDFHYWTQPLPVGLSHYVHHLPSVLGKLSVAIMFAIEFGAPLLLFGTRTMRHIGVAAIVFLMAAIAATGNYGFFNLLTVVICLALLDDRAILRVLPFARVSKEITARSMQRLWTVASVAFATCVLLVTSWSARWIEELPAPLEEAMTRLAPFASFNAYGLFADMTEERPEVIVEGSNDGVTWKTYGFRWKPGELDRRPRFAGPHMPRLDWQMWFAALRGTPPRWFDGFLEALLQGSPDVLELLEEVPFGGEAPLLVRARLYRYEFSAASERTRGIWWTRKFVRPFGPPRTLGADGRILAR